MVTREAPVAADTEGQQRLKMTYEEFLQWADEDTHAEWVNGEVIVFMPTKDEHQTVMEFLFALMEFFVRFFNMGKIRLPPFELKATPEGSSREPDIMFVAGEHADRRTRDRVAGAPDLIVEIVSNDSVHRDRVDKFEEYEDAGVPEYWVIDPRPGRQRADFYQLDKHGKYQPVPVGEDGIYRSKTIPGFWLNVNWLWAEELPDPQLTFAEIAGFPPEVVAQLRALKAKAGETR